MCYLHPNIPKYVVLTMAQVNEERFIKVVMERPFLYDKSHPVFKSLEKKNSVWREIGSEFGVSGEEAQKQFKAMREKYVRIKKEMEKYERSGAGAYYKNKWHLFEIMRFLDEVIKPRKTTSSFNSPSSCSLFKETEDTQDGQEPIVVQIDSTITGEELIDLNLVSPVSSVASNNNESQSEIPTMSARKENTRSNFRSNKRQKLEEQFSNTLEALTKNFQETPCSDAYVHAFCVNIEQEMLKMPSNVMEDFKDEVSELLLRKRREMRNNI